MDRIFGLEMDNDGCPNTKNCSNKYIERRTHAILFNWASYRSVQSPSLSFYFFLKVWLVSILLWYFVDIFKRIFSSSFSVYTNCRSGFLFTKNKLNERFFRLSSRSRDQPFSSLILFIAFVRLFFIVTNFSPYLDVCMDFSLDFSLSNFLFIFQNCMAKKRGRPNTKKETMKRKYIHL